MLQQALMNVTVKCEYALRAVLDLAMANSSQPVRIADIAGRQRIPQKFLESILAELKKAGFLESRRGAEGGYLLARPAETITVGQILRVIEGGRTGRAGLDEPGPLDPFWARIDEAVAGVVDRASFADLAREVRDSRSRHVPNWEI